MKKEIWKDIPGYEGLYKASSLGRIKSLKRTKKMKRGVWPVRERILATVRSNGYWLSHLCRNNERKLIKTHRLVAMAFLQRELGELQVNHINGIKTDNRLTNLELVSCQENIAHAHALGLSKSKGEHNPNANLNAEQVLAVRKKLSAGERPKQIAQEFKVGLNTIYKIKTGRTWTHLA